MKLTYIICFWICFDATVGQDNRIVGGRPAKVGEFPYQVSIKKRHDGKHICGGVIISPRFVLSAAHCLVAFTSSSSAYPPSYFIVVAAQLTHPITNTSIYRTVSRSILHNFRRLYNDIGLLQLKKKLPLNTLISTVPLNKETINSGTCIVTGWGFLERDGPRLSDDLMAAEVYIIDYKKCKKMHANLMPVLGTICAGHPHGTTDACRGDSGGPLVCNGLLVGIVSMGFECASAKYPGIYTDVAYHLPWIENQTSIRFS